MNGAEFKAIREKLGCEAQAFARALGYGGSAQSLMTVIYNFESGRRQIPPARARLATMLSMHGMPDGVEMQPPKARKAPATKAAPTPPAKTAVEILIELGRELHGEHWIGPTARDLDIAHRTVANWVSGKSRFREGPILDALRLLVRSHAAAVDRARQIAKAP